ncbi:unnamed protein product [Schistocephalus solidus]|uniref:Uncharacterized protein n=1 Tax=Schistocephalus solidus TaxID=70667 RepID=A0A183TD02_SCHSO|nr:unnamed protein product [Schistocephalus solidus]
MRRWTGGHEDDERWPGWGKREWERRARCPKFYPGNKFRTSRQTVNATHGKCNPALMLLGLPQCSSLPPPPPPPPPPSPYSASWFSAHGQSALVIRPTVPSTLFPHPTTCGRPSINTLPDPIGSEPDEPDVLKRSGTCDADDYSLWAFRTQNFIDGVPPKVAGSYLVSFLDDLAVQQLMAMGTSLVVPATPLFDTLNDLFDRKQPAALDVEAFWSRRQLTAESVEAYGSWC